MPARTLPSRRCVSAIVAWSCGESPHTRCAYCSSFIASRLRPTDNNDAMRPAVGIGRRRRRLTPQRRRDRGAALPGQALHRQPAVIRVVIIGGGQAQARDAGLDVAGLLRGASRPIQPRGPIVGAGKLRRAAVEILQRVGELPAAIRPPSGLPRGALGEAARGIAHQHLAEHLRPPRRPGRR